MEVFLIFHTVGSWLAWMILKSFRKRATYLVEIDRSFIATEENRKRVLWIARIGEVLVGNFLWPIVVSAYCSDSNSLENAYVRAFHQRVLAVFTRRFC